ncbi:intermediate filament tail domain-containing protein 1 [Cricetulus griseus]|nr:intermediate filament tail domain-containing protein 1 [Cricetulus griseus]
MMETKNTVKALTSDFEINKQETKMHLEETREEKLGNLTPAKQPSSVHFFPEIIDLEATPMQLSTSTSQNIPFNLPQVTNAQNSGLTLSSAGPLTSKSTLLSIPRGDASLSKQSSSFLITKKQPLLSFDSETFVLGEGEDYFLSLFGDSRKLNAHSSQTEDMTKHLSVILEEVGQFTSSFLEDIKIAEVNVKGLFVRLMNSSTDKETEIGNHILQQNVNGQAVSLYRFPPNIIMHASSTVTMPLQPQGLRRLRHKELQLYPGKCKDTFLTFNDTEKPICAERLMTVTSVDLSWNPSGICQQQTAFSKVWAAASEAKPQPPTDFVWEEQIRFRSSPDCTTILCKPHGEAIAWYTPIHWKQAWEKLETDIEFDRCSVVIPTLKKRMFGQRTASMSSINKEKQEPAKEPSQCRIDHIYPALPKEKEILPSTLPTRSPWCCNPHTSPHPYCSLIEPHDPDTSEKRLDTQLKSRPAKLASAPDSSGFVFFLSTVLSGNEKSFAPDLHFIFVGRQCVAATRVIPTWVAYAATKTMVTSKYKLRLRATSGSMVLLQLEGKTTASDMQVGVAGTAVNFVVPVTCWLVLRNVATLTSFHGFQKTPGESRIEEKRLFGLMDQESWSPWANYVDSGDC